MQNTKTINFRIGIIWTFLRSLRLHFLCSYFVDILRNVAIIRVYFIFVLNIYVVRDSYVGIETGCGLDGPGIESQWGRNFRTHPEEPWDQCSHLYKDYWVIFGDKVAGGLALNTHLTPPSRTV